MDTVTHFTFDFIHPALPSDARRILEVGCGDGRLAAELAALNLDVTALDCDPVAVQSAIHRGVNSLVADWPHYESSQPFDAILFTRSLHHIPLLDAAVQRAADLLAPAGVVIVEDHAIDEIDLPTATWFHTALRQRVAAGPWWPADDSFAAMVCSADDPLDPWRQHRINHPDLHPARAVAAAIERRFSQVAPSTAPYLFRFLHQSAAAAQPSAAVADAAVRAFLEQEQRARAANQIQPIGRRFIARTPTAA